MADNLISSDEFSKRRRKKTFGDELSGLVSDEEAQRLIEALFLGQGSCTEAEGEAIVRWSVLARVRGIILNAILDGRANAALDGKGEVRIVPIESDGE